MAKWPTKHEKNNEKNLGIHLQPVILSQNLKISLKYWAFSRIFFQYLIHYNSQNKAIFSKSTTQRTRKKLKKMNLKKIIMSKNEAKNANLCIKSVIFRNFLKNGSKN